MKDKNFIIKVSDLLQEAGKKDTIHFEHKFSDMLPNLSKLGITGDILLHSMSTDSLFATFQNLSCTMNEHCDGCEKAFEREVIVPEYGARFVIGEEMKKLEEETTDEEIFLIDARNETIDIEDMLIQAIRLQDPIILRCENCQKHAEKLPDDEDEIDYLESGGTVVIHK